MCSKCKAKQQQDYWLFYLQQMLIKLNGNKMVRIGNKKYLFLIVLPVGNGAIRKVNMNDFSEYFPVQGFNCIIKYI